MLLTRFSVRHFMAVLVMCVGIVILGSSAYLAMPRENFPDVKVPVVTVTTVLEGANPTDVETSVTIPLETELDGVEGLEELRSTSSEGLSLIRVEFDRAVDTDLRPSDLRVAAQAQAWSAESCSPDPDDDGKE